MADALDAYLNQDFAGRLEEVKGRLSFAYDKAWLVSDRFIPLSVTMPRTEAPFPDEIARAFFENLLPEGEIRKTIARLKQLSERNTFGLLGEIGGDCAGAISLWPKGEKRRAKEGYAAIGDERLRQLLSNMKRRPLLLIENELRLSLAGAQNKLPVRWDGTELSLPMGGATSSHILKPGSPGYAHLPVNEHFCMRLAGALGLPVPDSTLLRKPEPIYLVERYDRTRGANGALTRIHQIDFCQALNLPSARKYEKEGGPNLKACFEVVTRYSKQPAKDRLHLISWVIFNTLIGNADAHAKNLSLLITREGISLAPSYDLISTGVYPDLTPNLALRIGGESRPDWIRERHWEAFSEVSGVNPRIVWKRIAELSDAITEAQRSVLADLALDEAERDLLDGIHALIERRAGKLAGFCKAREHR